MKVSMHSYLPNSPINLRLNFNFEKLVKHETPLCNFAKVGLKGGENILEFLKSLDAQLEDNTAREIFRCSKIFSTPLSPTLANPHNGVSLLTNFS